MAFSNSAVACDASSLSKRSWKNFSCEAKRESWKGTSQLNSHFLPLTLNLWPTPDTLWKYRQEYQPPSQYKVHCGSDIAEWGLFDRTVKWLIYAMMRYGMMNCLPNQLMVQGTCYPPKCSPPPRHSICKATHMQLSPPPLANEKASMQVLPGETLFSQPHTTRAILGTLAPRAQRWGLFFRTLAASPGDFSEPLLSPDAEGGEDGVGHGLAFSKSSRAP